MLKNFYGFKSNILNSLFETLQTLYWGVFGLVEKDRLELHRRHVFTMFIGLTMFGTYCAIMIIILINMLIAMMNNSYQRIAVNLLIKIYFFLFLSIFNFPFIESSR